jgi:hypothetical protein
MVEAGTDGVDYLAVGSAGGDGWVTLIGQPLVHAGTLFQCDRVFEFWLTAGLVHRDQA